MSVPRQAKPLTTTGNKEVIDMPCDTQRMEERGRRENKRA